MPDYVQHLVDQYLPTCPHCQHRNTEQVATVPDGTILLFDCPRCATQYQAKAEIYTVWSTLNPEKDDG